MIVFLFVDAPLGYKRNVGKTLVHDQGLPLSDTDPTNDSSFT